MSSPTPPRWHRAHASLPCHRRSRSRLHRRFDLRARPLAQRTRRRSRKRTSRCRKTSVRRLGISDPTRCPKWRAQSGSRQLRPPRAARRMLRSRVTSQGRARSRRRSPTCGQSQADPIHHPVIRRHRPPSRRATTPSTRAFVTSRRFTRRRGHRRLRRLLQPPPSSRMSSCRASSRRTTTNRARRFERT